ncbi:unnamed protein product [Spodoptera littoralis]|uniref:C2H2-type domain-containing protein n=1 Tax=Spodoptera littoralis TaxID=7109 RepID=A0A9P0I776_SPOLI|nr:unnamed protein product [Spodoptera littoralis]CAH1641478.1 unnamed protein product [Spodoptera littoralis]
MDKTVIPTSMEKLYKNLIFCGEIDFYCIGCRELFHSIPEVEKHIRWEKHRTFLKNQSYISSYKKDCILKIHEHFYCEICNYVFTDKDHIIIHIESESHISTKMKRNTGPPTEPPKFIGIYDSEYVVIKKVILDMPQWNTITNQKCYVCDEEVPNTLIRKHMKFGGHIINLIQSKTIYEEERYYRLVCRNQRFCFTCKKTFSAEDFDDHWSTCQNIEVLEIQRLKETRTAAMEDIAKMQEIQKKLISTVQEFYWVDEKNNIATCRYCKTVVNILFKPMIDHMKNKHDNHQSSDESSSDEEVQFSEVIDFGKRRKELAEFGRQHHVRLNHNASKGWCSVCDCYMSAHKRVFKIHIRGYIHKGFLEIQGLTPPVHEPEPRDFKTISVYDYSLEYIPSEKAFHIDNKYVVDVFSFFLLFKIEGNPHVKKTKCFACNELIAQGQERKHCETAEHKEKFLEAKLIEPGKNKDAPNFGEYIREIKPNLYHCGLCNRTFPFRASLEFHKASNGHQSIKTNRIVNPEAPAIVFNTRHDDVYIKLLTICLKDQAK